MSGSHRLQNHALAISLCLATAFLLPGCGGSGASVNAIALAGDAAVSQPAQDFSPAPDAGITASPAPSAPAVIDQTQPVLALPSGIVDGGTIALECGRVYRGTLKLAGRSNVTVKTEGSCGNATITAGQAITGWTKQQGNVYSAPVPFDAAQLLIDGQPMARAHWPAQSQTWARATSASANALSYALPNSDVVGATLLFRSNDWSIEARKVTGYSGTTMSVASTGDISFDGYALGGQPDFYLEGKLWMLDEPGEWAVDNGRLYIWMPDGQSPEGRIFAAPDADVVDAQNAKSISIAGVDLYGGTNGVNALNASNLRLTDVNIANTSGNGVLNSGGKGLYVDRATIRNSRHDAIAIKWGGGGETIQNSTIDATGVIGMPTNLHAAINLVASDGAKVSNNKITRSGYIGIRVFRNAVVSQNTVDTACTVLTDCGGIYVYSENQAALNTQIDGNIITNVGGKQKLAWAIDLDNNANGVTVTNNTIANNANGMQLHDAFGNTISGNHFSGSVLSHIQMVEDGSGASVRDNQVKANTFTSVNGEETYRVSSTLGAGSVLQFATYADNAYTSSSAIFANFNGEPLGYAQWTAKTGQDATSTFKTP